jgi:hypothetical protein
MSRCFLPHLHLRTETDPVSETSCSLEYQTMEKVQNPSNSVILTVMYFHYRPTALVHTPGFLLCDLKYVGLAVSQVKRDKRT